MTSPNIFCVFLLPPSSLFHFLDSTYKWYHMILVLSVWLTSLSMIISRFHPCCYKWDCFIVFYGWVIFHSIYHIFIDSSVDRHLGCFHVLAIILIKSAAMNIGIYVSFWIIVYSRYMLKSRIAESYGNSIFGFFWNLHAVFHSGCTNLHCHQQCRKVPFSLYSPHHLLFVNFIHSPPSSPPIQAAT